MTNINIGINTFHKTIKIYEDIDLNHLCNMINYKYKNFREDNLVPYTLINEDETWTRRIKVDPYFLQRYVNDAINHIKQIKS